MERPTFRQRALRFFLRDELEKLDQATSLLLEGYRQGPALLSPASLERSLRETDSQLIDLIMRQRGYTVIGDRKRLDEQDRLRAVEESRYMMDYNVTAQCARRMWTDFGFGSRMLFTFQDALPDKVWNDFWKADRNAPLLKERKIQVLSNTMIEDGEIFFVVWVSKLDGDCTLRMLKTDQVKRIEYEDDSQLVAQFYIQDTPAGEVWYPNWQLSDITKYGYEFPPGAIPAWSLNDDTEAYVVHGALEERNGRGWPPFMNAYPWMRAYKGFLEDRATLAKAVAMFVDEVIHKGGDRITDALTDKFQSSLVRSGWGETNPSAVTGSTLIHNDAIETRRRPLTTGAGDAQTDGMTLLAQVSTGTGVPPHWLGRPDSMQNKAVAQETKLPWIEQLERYQLFWADVFRDIVTVVLRQKNKYSKGVVIIDAEPYISMETPADVQIGDAPTLLEIVKAASEVLSPGEAKEAILKITVTALKQYGIALTPEAARDPHDPELVAQLTKVLYEDVAQGKLSIEAAAATLSEIVA